MSQFSDQILWPNQIDNFPWLFNKGETDEVEATILYAEHHNKIRNFVVEAQELLGSATAIGDGTLKGITYAYSLHSELGPLLASNAFNAWASSTTSQPGNMLPFEFVFTKSTDNYSAWPASQGGGGVPYPILLVQGTESLLNDVVRGLTFFNLKPMVTCAIRPTSPPAGWPTGGMFGGNPIGGYHYLVNTSCHMGSSTGSGGNDTLVVRGCITDLSIPYAASDWDLYADYWLQKRLSLHLSLFGVQT